MTDVWDRYCLIHNLLYHDAPVSENVGAVISALEACNPHDDWSKLRELPYEVESASLHHDWLLPVLIEDPPKRVPIKGLWFGLFHPIRDGEMTTDMYIAGSPFYQHDADDASWASNPEYFPDGRYAFSQVLASVHRIAYTANHLEDAQEFVCLSYLAFTVKQLLFKVDPFLILDSNQSVGVAVGWDSGDPLYIGSETDCGFVPRNPTDAACSLEERKETFDAEFGDIE